MEEEVKETPRRKRRVSLFKRRKKAELRHLVRQRKQSEYKKIIGAFILFVAIITILAAALYFIRYHVIEPILTQNTQILTPQGTQIIDNSKAQDLINSGNLHVTDIQFATDSVIITFTIKNKTRVVLTKNKDLAKQMELVEAIDRQITMDGKQAISIDLRYNKPIVKF